MSTRIRPNTRAMAPVTAGIGEVLAFGHQTVHQGLGSVLGAVIIILVHTAVEVGVIIQ